MTPRWSQKSLSCDDVGAAIPTLRVDFPVWTVLGWERPTGRVSFQLILDSHCVLAGYLSYVQDFVLCTEVKVLYMQVS